MTNLAQQVSSAVRRMDVIGRQEWNADAVAALRRKLGMTQVQFALVLGTGENTVSQWERGIYLPSKTFSRQLTLLAERTTGGDYPPPVASPPGDVAAVLMSRARAIRDDIDARQADGPIDAPELTRLLRHAKALETAAKYELDAAKAAS